MPLQDARRLDSRLNHRRRRQMLLRHQRRRDSRRAIAAIWRALRHVFAKPYFGRSWITPAGGLGPRLGDHLDLEAAVATTSATKRSIDVADALE